MTDGVMNKTMELLPVALNVTTKVKAVVDPLIDTFQTIDNATAVAADVLNTSLPILGIVRSGAQGLMKLCNVIADIVNKGNATELAGAVTDIAAVVQSALDAATGPGEPPLDLGGIATTLRDAIPQLTSLVGASGDVLAALGVDALAQVRAVNLACQLHRLLLC